MKKFTLTIVLFAILCLIGCDMDIKDGSYRQEQPCLYWKDIDATIIDIDKRHWFATTHWYVVYITVKSEEYGLIENFEIKGSGAFGCPYEWNYEKGQTVTVQLYSWVMESTGEIVKRKINKIY